MAKSKAERNSKLEGVVPSEINLEDFFAPATPDEALANKLVSIAQIQIKTSNDFKRKRMEEVQKSIDLYDGKTKKALKGRWNVPLPLMSGFADALLSKVDDPPKVNFSYQDIADMRRAAKVQAKFDDDSSDSQGRWAAKDRLEKKLAVFYGVGIKKYFAYNDKEGNYHSHYEVVDPLDFECEPLGGQHLKGHKFLGQRNIFKTDSEVRAGAMGNNPIYNKKQVLHLQYACNSDMYKKFEKVVVEKTDRMKSLGFNPELNSYVGQKVYNFTEWYMEYEGVWYYLLFELNSGIWIRFDLLSNVFGSGRHPFVAWHTHPDAFNFWSKAPADDMRPVAEGMSIIFNQMLDARERNTYRQRAFDPEMFPDASQLEWRPDGLVEVDTNGGARAIGSGIYEFRVEGMTESGTINLLSFMDSITGSKTGVQGETPGAKDDQRVGIYYGNLQQIADRLGLYNKSYSEAWAELGYLYYWGLRDHIKNNRMMVRMIGSSGYNWVELKAEDLDPEREFNITITGGQAEIAKDELAKKQRTEALAALLRVPQLVNEMNPRALAEELLKNGTFTDEAIKRLMNKTSYGSEETMSKAHQAIQDILNGRKPKMYRGADELFMQTIIDFASDAEDLKPETFDQMIAYAESHVEIVIQNMVRREQLKARIQMESQAMFTGGSGAAAVLDKVKGPAGIQNIAGSPAGADNISFDEGAAGNTPAGTAARSADITATMTP